MDRGTWWVQPVGLHRVGYDLRTKQQLSTTVVFAALVRAGLRRMLAGPGWL